MNWLNLELTTLRSEEYLGSEPSQRATWLNLMAYCADQENGGVIKKCIEWPDRKWMQLLGVTKSEVLEICDLWNVNSDSISVVFYPKAKELEVKAKREAGKKGGRPPKTKATKPSGLTELKPSKSEAITEEERKGKEEEVEEEEEDKLLSLPAEAVKVTDRIISHVRTLNPNQKNINKPKIDKTRLSWAMDVEKLNRIDERSWEDINRVWSFVERDEFWSTNVLSGDKLRKQFDVLFIKSVSDKPKPVEV